MVELIAYYTTWFKTGVEPEVVRDALYYFHRRQPAGAPLDRSQQTAGEYVIPAGPAADDNVELLSFLTEPGRLVITQGDDSQVMEVGSPGMVSFVVPMVPGTTPQFELQRDGQVVESLTSATPIQSEVVYQDMTYYAGASLDCDRPA